YWLEHCQSCSLPELACVFNRSGIDYHVVSGYMQEDYVWQEINNWVDAARVAEGMRNNRVGILGHYYNGMLDVYSDLTQQSATFGNHFEILEMCELLDLRQAVTEQEIETKVDEFKQKFDVSEECEISEIRRAAQTSVALDKLIKKHNLGSMAYYYEGSGEYENIVTSVIAGNTLLTGANTPIAGECEIKNVQAMKIMDLFGVGGSFSEFYLSDFKDDVVYLGHDGPAHFAIAEGSVGLVPLPIYHGKPGQGLSIQMTVKHGPVTVLSVVTRRDGSVFLQVCEGESVPGPVLQIGNTNSRYKFPMGAREFMNEWSRGGPSHHCAIGVGHISNKLEKLADILGIKVRKLT
ncbi:MAG: L-fucose/L-arabinose isomerase family protein, partial [Glaciecola sp.]